MGKAKALKVASALIFASAAILGMRTDSVSAQQSCYDWAPCQATPQDCTEIFSLYYKRWIRSVWGHEVVAYGTPGSLDGLGIWCAAWQMYSDANCTIVVDSGDAGTQRPFGDRCGWT